MKLKKLNWILFSAGLLLVVLIGAVAARPILQNLTSHAKGKAEHGKKQKKRPQPSHGSLLATVEDIPNLAAFWTFEEPAGSPRKADLPKKSPLELVEGAGPVERVATNGELALPYAARLNGAQWLTIPRAKIGELDIFGRFAEITVVAWVKFKTIEQPAMIAGVWSEGRNLRQYALGVAENSRYRAHNNCHGFLSRLGVPTHNFPDCVTYATGGTELKPDQWYCLAFIRSKTHISIYVNGKLDRNKRKNDLAYVTGNVLNPFKYRDGIMEAGTDGADFTVGAVEVEPGRMGKFFDGDIAALAVFSRPLKGSELRRLTESALPETKETSAKK